MTMPATRYARSGNVHVAYQVFGSGPIDLVFVPGFVSHIENSWEHPDLARWLLRLGSFARVVMFDKRGTGLSDPVSEVPSLDLRMDDVQAVMDAAGIERAAQLGVSEGGALATLFAATYPQRCRGLVLYGSFARSHWLTAELLEAYLRYTDRGFSPLSTARREPCVAPAPLRSRFVRSEFKSAVASIPARSKSPTTMCRASLSISPRVSRRSPGRAMCWYHERSRI